LVDFVVDFEVVRPFARPVAAFFAGLEPFLRVGIQPPLDVPKGWLPDQIDRET
jgi:hypothetical protein